MSKIIGLLLILFGCSSCAKSDFVTVTFLNCNPIKELYNSKQLKYISPVMLESEECLEVYKNVRIRKSLILSFADKASIMTDKINQGDDDPSSPLEVTKVNVMHCSLEFEHKFQDIEGTCGQMEKKIN